MINIPRLKLMVVFAVLGCALFTGNKVFAWVESPANPIYDPINAAEKAYYPSVLKMGTNDYRMWYQSNSTTSNTTVAYATSADGIVWTMITNSVSGLIPNNAGHPHVEFVDGKYRIWYWNATTPYGNDAMHYAESVDGISWTNDSPISGNLTTTASGQWNSGIYGAADVIVNNSPLNSGANPFDYKYAMYYDATSGGYEQIALGYSADGINWTLYGTGPVVARGAAGTWDSGYVAIGSTVTRGTKWTLWYSGGISASNEGIGCATSDDGLVWTKCVANPLMSKADGVAWRNSRTYTPTVVRDEDVYKMWFTGRDTATSNYTIGYATQGISGDVFRKAYSGEAALSDGVSKIVLSNATVMDISANVNSVSNGTIITGGVAKGLSNFTGGDLVNVDLSTAKNVGGEPVAIGKGIKISSGLSGTSIKLTNTDLLGARVAIPDDVTIFASSSWDGVIAPPKVGSSSGDTPPSGFSISSAIDIGSPKSILLFDRPVEVTLSGVTGSVGYKQSGSTLWRRITDSCGGTYDAPTISAAAFPGECSITNGVDTKILTYHLTTFGGLTEVVPIPATLHVITLVVNGSGGTGPGVLVPANFMIHVKNSSSTDVATSPVVGVAAPGTTYTLLPGTYTISEDANTTYVKSFSLIGACDSNGSVTLGVGEEKTCTIINTDIPLPPAVVPVSGGGGGSAAIIAPMIGVLKVPNVFAISATSGSVTYNYTVWNVGGRQAMTDIKVTDDKCGPVAFLSGDLNGDKKLDPGEKWNYSCTTMFATTTTNTTVATGISDDPYRQTAIATAISTVVVGATTTPPLIAIVKVPSQVTPAPSGGSEVVYGYAISNIGQTPVRDIVVADDKCKSIVGPLGDANGNTMLDPGEIWTYTCRTNIADSTRSIVAVEGKGNGFSAVGYAFTDVIVAVPGFSQMGASQGAAFGKDVMKAQAIVVFSRSLGTGSEGEDVSVLQTILEQKGLLRMPEGVDKGYFGELTRAAIKAYQESVGLPSVGVLGPRTTAKLISELGE